MELHPITRIMLFVEILLSITVILCVAFQQTKSEGLSGTIGGASSSSFRGSRQDQLLATVTRYAGPAWIVTSTILAICWERLRV